MREILDEIEATNFMPMRFSEIEEYYELLAKLQVRVPKSELESVSTLFARCDRFSKEVPAVCHQLMTEQRSKFEQLLDTQLKDLMVASIHLRDSFDDQGPIDPNISAAEASQRLKEIESRFLELVGQKKVIITI